MQKECLALENAFNAFLQKNQRKFTALITLVLLLWVNFEGC